MKCSTVVFWPLRLTLHTDAQHTALKQQLAQLFVVHIVAAVSKLQLSKGPAPAEVCLVHIANLAATAAAAAQAACCTQCQLAVAATKDEGLHRAKRGHQRQQGQHYPCK